MAKILDENEFKTLVLESDDNVLVDFFATWCGPCKMMAPVIDALSEEATDLKVYKVDVDDCPNVSEKYNVMSIPTLIYFEKGEPVKKKVGAVSKEMLLEWLASK